ncbi:MAG: hypothetical protein IJE69_08250 [Alistipes sp.]|nr:hypothetical protein [Alistipes sp.]
MDGHKRFSLRIGRIGPIVPTAPQIRAFRPFFNSYTLLFAEIQKSHFSTDHAIFHPIFRKTTRNFDAAHEKSPDFSKKVHKIHITPQNLSFSDAGRKTKIFIFAKTNLNKQNNVILVAI